MDSPGLHNRYRAETPKQIEHFLGRYIFRKCISLAEPTDVFSPTAMVSGKVRIFGEVFKVGHSDATSSSCPICSHSATRSCSSVRFLASSRDRRAVSSELTNVSSEASHWEIADSRLEIFSSSSWARSCSC